MKKAVKYGTFKKTQFALFTHSYAKHYIYYFIKKKYKIPNYGLINKDLRRKFFSKYSAKEISRLSRVFNFNYMLLWKTIMLDKNKRISKNISHDERVRIYLSIEKELIKVFKMKKNTSDFIDPEYNTEFGPLTLAIERAVGNSLSDIEDDKIFQRKLESLKKKYFYCYYKISKKYKLPTINIVPFITRLIS